MDTRGLRVADRRVTRAILIEMARETSARTFRITAPALAYRDTAILGRLSNFRCHSGLHVHATDTLEAHDLDAGWDMEPSVTIAVMLEGLLDVRLDNQTMRIGNEDRPSGHAWSLTEDTRLTRKSRKGTRIRKVVITIPRNRNLADFANTHRANITWSPSPHAVSLAEQILNPTLAPSAFQNMSTDSRALEIVREALTSIVTPEESALRSAPPRTKEQVRAQTIRAYLNENRARNPTLQQIARDLGMSVASMQTAFKATYNSTIADFSRELRLQNARAAIERDGISVGEAAYIAGYSNPANFSTAFKRFFGLSPSDVKV